MVTAKGFPSCFCSVKICFNSQHSPIFSGVLMVSPTFHYIRDPPPTRGIDPKSTWAMSQSLEILNRGRFSGLLPSSLFCSFSVVNQGWFKTQSHMSHMS